MIFGIGTDLTQINRIKDAMSKNPSRFAKKLLTNQEFVVYQERCSMPLEKGLRYLASRFAAKEAFSKAMGIGFRAPMSWHSIQVLNDEFGAPRIELSGPLKEWIDERNIKVNISISDEKEYAIAFVILEIMV